MIVGVAATRYIIRCETVNINVIGHNSKRIIRRII